MDNSSVLIDNMQFKNKIGEVIESSVNLIEKGTLTIFKELNKMREDYSSLINKCKFIILTTFFIFQLLIFVKRKIFQQIFWTNMSQDSIPATRKHQFFLGNTKQITLENVN